MSCNGCRILRKGCSDDCLLRQCLQWIDNPQAQANATLFVAKFFGRSGLMSFISSVPKNQRPALFQSLLFEAVGRTVNPVSGAVGLLGTGNWHVCQTVAMTVLRGGAIQALPEFGGGVIGPELDNISECASFRPRNESSSGLKRKRSECGPSNLDFCLMFPAEEKPQREGTPSEESGTSTLGSGNCSLQAGGERKLLTLFI